jgi:hypothetical protein
MKLAHRSHYRDHAELVVRTLPLPSPPLGLEAAGDSAGVGSGPGGWMADALRVHSLKSFIAPKQPGGGGLSATVPLLAVYFSSSTPVCICGLDWPHVMNRLLHVHTYIEYR